MTIHEQIEVMQYYANGGKIEYKVQDIDWVTVSTPNWNWVDCDYRIKPEPFKKEFIIIKTETDGWSGWSEFMDFVESLKSPMMYKIPVEEIF